MTISETAVTVNSPLSWSQNILNWACVSNLIISGNPSVSLAGQMTVDSNGNPLATFRMHQSGQIIVGARACGLDLTSTADTNTNNGNTARTTGQICDQSIDRTVTP